MYTGKVAQVLVRIIAIHSIKVTVFIWLFYKIQKMELIKTEGL
jgi:hypothetical protein